MTKLHVSVRSCTYKSGIFQGFSRLQQSDEFVDMTLAADGHLVKVHQTLVALASPYLKNMLLSIPSRHPVIFLNGISHEVLGFILEYIYTGEVEIPAEKVHTFLKAAQAMHISGLKTIIPPTDNENPCQIEQTNLVFQNPQQPHPAAKPIITTQNDSNVDLQLQEPIIDLSDIESDNVNETNSHSPFNIDIPMPLEGNNKNENIRNMNTCGNSVTTSYNVCNDNTRKKPVAKIEILSDIRIQKPLPETKETDAQIPLNLDIPTSLEENKEFNSLRHVNTCGKSINISYNNNMNMDSDSPKPVANIEIVSNILPPENINAITDQGLPQLDADALENMKKVIGNYFTMDGSVSQLQNISNQLIAQQSNPVSEPTESDNIDIKTNENCEIAEDTASVIYTASNRGALQLILNKFIYNCHHQTYNGRKRRWRCIDYRDFRCKAAVDTEDGRIINTKHEHSHPNHEQKIIKKIVEKQSKVFSSIQMAEDILRNHKSDTNNVVTGQLDMGE